MKIEVTQDDIDKGIKCRHESCPIALAVKRQVENNGVSVDRTRAIIYGDDDNPSIFPLSKTCVKFIRDFDKSITVKPFKFILKYEPPTR